MTLRLWRAADVPAIVAACQDPEIPRWTLVPDDYTADDARLWLATHEPGLRSGRRVELAAVDARPPTRGELLGSIALVRHPTRTERAEIGYWVTASARGRGVATRTVRLTCAWAFEALAVERIELLAEPGNAASQEVARRAGFKRERKLRRHRKQKGTWRDFWLFVLHSDAVHPAFTPRRL